MSDDDYLRALQHCDDALGFVDDVRVELRAAEALLPIHAANLRTFLSRTREALVVVETRLHTASNSIRRVTV